MSDMAGAQNNQCSRPAQRCKNRALKCADKQWQRDMAQRDKASISFGNNYQIVPNFSP
jgi:hypothetical protein